MARRNGEQSARALKQEKWNRWRVLIRKPEFQKDVRALKRFYRETGGLAKPPIDLWSKWGVRLSNDILNDPTLPDLSPLTIQCYEGLFAEDPLIDFITTYDLHDGPYDEWQGPTGIKRGQFLVIEVDLSIPVSDLLPGIREAIKAAQKERPNGLSRGYLSPDRTRRSHSHLTFQLRVFDMYQNGEPVWKIARNVSKARGTVKSALRAAIKLILGDRPKTGRKWITKHLSTCDICSKDANGVCPEIDKFLMGPIQAVKQNQLLILPIKPLKSEKSAFPKWDAKHPSRRH